MEDLEIKKKIAQEIVDLMEQKGVDSLKSKSPKFAKVSVVEAGKINPMDEKSEPSKEMMGEKKGPMMEDEEELSPETIKKLIEMMNGK